MRWLNAQDHRWLCIEDLNNPLQIGALIFLHVDNDDISNFVDRARHVIDQRLPFTPWAVRYQPAPFDVDSGAWVPVEIDDISHYVSLHQSGVPITRRQLNDFIAREVLKPLPRDRAMFRITIFDSLAEDLRSHGNVAMLIQHHHALADGIGFQTAIQAISDATMGSSEPRLERQDSRGAPWRPVWFIGSLVRNRVARNIDRRRLPERRDAGQRLEQLKIESTYKRQRTAVISRLDGPSPQRRIFDFCELNLPEVRHVARSWGGSVNDVVMTVLGGAIRRYLDSIGALDELGDQSVVALVPRSLRQPEDGSWGNHITMVLPNLGTNIADPKSRFEVVRASMRAEIERSQLMFEATSNFERPFAARSRRNPEIGTSAGNVSISNVPGPDAPREFAGQRIRANYPTPSLVAGQFLNVTLRRYCDSLHLGLMSDPTKIHDVDTLVQLVSEEMDSLQA